jgi:hypothetical protein
MPLVILHHLLNVSVQLANKRGYRKNNNIIIIVVAIKTAMYFAPTF